jgi:hypothetical protein
MHSKSVSTLLAVVFPSLLIREMCYYIYVLCVTVCAHSGLGAGTRDAEPAGEKNTWLENMTWRILNLTRKEVCLFVLVCFFYILVLLVMFLIWCKGMF